MEFNVLKLAVQKQFELLQKYPMFRVDVDKEVLWNTYLAAFPEGTNPIYRVRSEYDCSCCRQFIKNVGDVVAVIDGKIVSLWDIKTPKEPAFQVVSDALAEFVRAAPIANVFYHFEKTAGTDKSFEHLVDSVKSWDHFFVNIKPKFVKPNADIPSALGEHRATHDVLLRGINELSLDAIDTVLDLIAQNSLYRGEENKFALTEFRKVKVAASTTTNPAFAWEQSITLLPSVSRIRNTAIGSLLIDLSAGDDLESAVKSFEAKVAPSNYRRPTSLVTPKMITQAKEKLNELGLTSALERRYATINDITVNNILFADRATRTVLTGDVFDELIASAPEKLPNFDKVEEVTIEKFITDMLPRTTSIEVLMQNNHISNLTSLIAPVDVTAGNLFKWDNKFSWSYNGEMTDAIKERVKNAGGNVDGDLCCRLAWEYTDDLDFYMYEPDGKSIYFGNRASKSRNGGQLDVDANGGSGMMEHPVENIFYSDRNKMQNGIYELKVNNFSRRSSGVGFTIQIEFDGEIHEFVSDKVVPSKATVSVAKIMVDNGKFSIVKSMGGGKTTAPSKSVWGISTNTFQKVNVLMMSPNFWDEKAVGNKHYFFMLDGCKNEGRARGFYNEFLKEDLNPHRKVFEVVSSKMQMADSDDQLSGLGFSSTQSNSVICRVKGAFTRTIKIKF